VSNEGSSRILRKHGKNDINEQGTNKVVVVIVETVLNLVVDFDANDDVDTKNVAVGVDHTT